MKNFIFIKKSYDGYSVDSTYYAIDADKIETLNVSDTYDQFGQLISDSDAGDSITLLTEKAVEAANKAAVDFGYEDKTFTVGDFISAYDASDLYSEVRSKVDDADIADNKETCKGFNYWDGHNFKTVTVDFASGEESSHFIVDDEALVAELNEAIANKEFKDDGFGQKIYTSGDWTIVDNFCEGAWAAFEIVRTEDFEAAKD